jgi:hypothetical protein
MEGLEIQRLDDYFLVHTYGTQFLMGPTYESSTFKASVQAA